MRTSSHFAIAGLTHAYSSFTAAPGLRPVAGRVYSLLFGHEGTRSYLRSGRPVDPSSSRRRGTHARTATHMNPHSRDFQESAR